jgi:hypothetical protein
MDDFYRAYGVCLGEGLVIYRMIDQEHAPHRESLDVVAAPPAAPVCVVVVDPATEASGVSSA